MRIALPAFHHISDLLEKVLKVESACWISCALEAASLVRLDLRHVLASGPEGMNWQPNGAVFQIIGIYVPIRSCKYPV
jgi:hypothetical protein